MLYRDLGQRDPAQLVEGDLTPLGTVRKARRLKEKEARKRHTSARYLYVIERGGNSREMTEQDIREKSLHLLGYIHIQRPVPGSHVRLLPPKEAPNHIDPEEWGASQSVAEVKVNFDAV